MTTKLLPAPRLATAEDAAPLARLAERTFRATFTEGNTRANMDAHCAKTYGPDVQAREIADPAMRTLVCESDGALIGYGQLRLGAAPPCVKARRPAQVHRIYVDTAFHGTGVARALMSEFRRSPRRLTPTDLARRLEGQSSRPRVHRKFGFEQAGEHAFRFGDEVQTDLVLARPARSIDLRAATPGDVETLFDIRCSVIENHQSRGELAAIGVTPDSVRRMIESGDYLSTIAAVDGRDVITMARISEGYVFACFVRPDCEARGVGKALMLAMDEDFALPA